MKRTSLFALLSNHRPLRRRQQTSTAPANPVSAEVLEDRRLLTSAGMAIVPSAELNSATKSDTVAYREDFGVETTLGDVVIVGENGRVASKSGNPDAKQSSVAYREDFGVETTLGDVVIVGENGRTGDTFGLASSSKPIDGGTMATESQAKNAASKNGEGLDSIAEAKSANEVTVSKAMLRGTDRLFTFARGAEVQNGGETHWRAAAELNSKVDLVGSHPLPDWP